MIYLLAKNYSEAEHWCRHSEPQVKKTEVIVLTDPSHDRKLFGQRFRERDRIVIYHGGPRGCLNLYMKLKELNDISPGINIELEHVWSV